jgi:hypothetical protein
MKQLSLLSIFILAGLFAIAQQSLTIPYQALVRDAAGNPVTNQQIGAKITLLQDSIAGPEVFSETHTVTSNTFGQMELQIGSVNTTAFDTIDWSAGKIFIRLEVEIQTGEGFQEIGTHQLLAVPFAKYAEEGGWWNKTDEGIEYQNGKLKVGTTGSPSYLNLDGGFYFQNYCSIDSNDQLGIDNKIIQRLYDTTHYYGYTKGLEVFSIVYYNSTIGSSDLSRYNLGLLDVSSVFGTIYGNSFGIWGSSYARDEGTVYGNSISVYGQGANTGHVTGDLIGVKGSCSSGGTVDGNRWAVYSNGNLYATNLKSRSENLKTYLEVRDSKKAAPIDESTIIQAEYLIEQDTILDLGKFNMFLLEKIDQLIQSNLQQQNQIEALQNEIETLKNK